MSENKHLEKVPDNCICEVQVGDNPHCPAHHTERATTTIDWDEKAGELCVTYKDSFLEVSDVLAYLENKPDVSIIDNTGCNDLGRQQ